MRSQGQVVKWFEDKGYGFIAAQASGAEVFVHVRDLPRTGRRPSMGDRVQFEVEGDDRGRKRAVRVTWEDPLPGGSPPPRAAAPSRAPGPRQHAHRPRRPARERRTGLLGMMIVVVILAYLGKAGWERFGPGSRATETPLAATPTTPALAKGEAFSCDGRRHCSEMRTCAEAQYFARNCPDTLMDGDGDGQACEQRCP